MPDLGFAMLCTLCSRWGWPFSHIRRAEQASVSLISRPPRVRTQLAVHIGLDASAKAIVLEQCAKNRGYRDADIRGFRPARGECLPDGPEVIASEVSMKAVSKRVAVEGVEVTFSRDAGRYVPRVLGVEAGVRPQRLFRPGSLPGCPPSAPGGHPLRSDWALAHAVAPQGGSCRPPRCRPRPPPHPHPHPAPTRPLVRGERRRDGKACFESH